MLLTAALANKETCKKIACPVKCILDYTNESKDNVLLLFIILIIKSNTLVSHVLLQNPFPIRRKHTAKRLLSEFFQLHY